MHYHRSLSGFRRVQMEQQGTDPREHCKTPIGEKKTCNPILGVSKGEAGEFVPILWQPS